MLFDARAAKLLQPGEHLVIDGCPGLRLEARASRRSWIYRYKSPINGKMKQVAIGQWPEMPVHAAAARWDELRQARAGGAELSQEKRAAKRAQAEPTSAMTVRNVVLLFVTGHLEVHRKPVGADKARRLLVAALDAAPNLAAKDAAFVTRSDAFDLIDSRKDTPANAAILRSLLGGAWDYALDAGKLDGNVPNWWRVVMKGRLKSKGKIVAGKHVGRAQRALRPAEVGELLTWSSNMYEVARDTLTMYLWTCTRGVEIVGIRPEHISEEADGFWWTVPKALTKNARYPQAVDLRVPLEGRALEVIRRRLELVGKAGWLFTDANGEQYLQKDFSTYINRLQPYSVKVRQRCGEGLVLSVTNWTPHDLRRTSRTILASLGCIKEVAEAILGHIPPDIEGTYNAYSYDKERRLWLRNLSTFLEGTTLKAVAPPAT